MMSSGATRSISENSTGRLFVHSQAVDADVPGNPLIGSTMKEIPEWLEKNLPRPSQGRHAVVSYKFFSRESPLRTSGLLGPVRLEMAE